VKRTIENVEAGKQVIARTLREIAQTLGVDFEDLLISIGAQSMQKDGKVIQDEAEPRSNAVVDSNLPGGLRVSESACTIEILIDKPFDSFNSEGQDHILRIIREVLPLSGDVRVISRRRGSVILTLELAPADAEKLLLAANAGRFVELGIIGARSVVASAQLMGDGTDTGAALTDTMRMGIGPSSAESERTSQFW
jgi:hypothetical protein